MIEKSQRELLIAVGFPVVIMGLNQFFLQQFADGSSVSLWQVAACLTVFVAIVAATSIVCGRFLRKWRRWAVLSWTLLAMDLMIFVVGASNVRSSSTAGEMLACAMISGQLDALVVWGILVQQKWAIPFVVASTVVAGGLVAWNTIFTSAHFSGGWISLMTLQALALAIMCGAMHRRGFRLDKVSDGRTSSSHLSSTRPWQFNIKEFLILMAVVAVVITVLRVSMSLRRTEYSSVSPLAVMLEALIAVLMATVLFTAIWLALGRQRLAARMSICAATTLWIGIVVSWGCSWCVELLLSPKWQIYQADFAWIVWYRWWWLPWLGLASGFLASILWFLRELGFGIMRK